MKKLLFLLLFIPLVILVSCNKTKYDPYSFKIDSKNGADIEQEIKFTINPKVIDSLKFSRIDLMSMAKEAARYADFGVTNTLTYEFINNDLSYNMIYFSEEYIVFAIKGQAKNNFGVSKKINSTIMFNIKTKEMKMKRVGDYELPDVLIY